MNNSWINQEIILKNKLNIIYIYNIYIYIYNIYIYIYNE